MKITTDFNYLIPSIIVNFGVWRMPVRLPDNKVTTEIELNIIKQIIRETINKELSKLTIEDINETRSR